MDSNPEEIIAERYGIELNWGEKVALNQYLEYCQRIHDEGYLKESAHGAAVHLFLLDNFGLDTVTISQFNHSDYNPAKPEELDFWLLDSGIKKAQFKQYCRNHIQQWREERELI